MRLKDRLRAFLHPVDHLPAPPTLVARLEALEAKLAALETLQLDRELQWTETKDKLLRYLKRVQELDRRHGSNSGGEGDAHASALAQVLALKYPKRGE
jgi:hypothetical protein